MSCWRPTPESLFARALRKWKPAPETRLVHDFHAHRAYAKAIAKNKAKGLPTDYESLKMPAETENYLPKLQAVKNIVRDPEKFGLVLADIPDARACYVAEWLRFAEGKLKRIDVTGGPVRTVCDSAVDSFTP